MMGHPLSIALAAAVPLRLAELRTLPADELDDLLARWAGPDGLGSVTADELGTYGDVLLYGDRRHPGRVAAYFAHLVNALAVLAFSPGGVSAFGQHWKAVR
jgi:hypothetical protein